MANIQQLREHKNELARQANHILAEMGAQTWTKEQSDKYDGIMDEIERNNAMQNAIQRAADLTAETAFSNATPGKKGVVVGDETAILAAVGSFLRHGSNVDAETAVAIRNAMSTTTTTEGGYTVPALVADMVVDSLKAFGGMRSLATILQTAGGNALTYPTSDGTAEVGAIVAENTAASTGEITFGNVAVNPYKYSSNKLALPWELIADSAIDVVSFVTQRLATRLARITNQHYTTGTGSGQPYGVMARASTGKTGTTGQTLTVIYDDLVDLYYSVNSQYRSSPKCAWMMADSSMAVIRKLKDTASRPVFVPAFETGIQGGTPDQLLGKPIVINDQVAAMGVSAKSIAFGAFDSYLIRDVTGVDIRRFDDSAFALNGQVGFCGWMRTGGNLLDTAAVKVYVNSAT